MVDHLFSRPIAEERDNTDRDQGIPTYKAPQGWESHGDADIG